MNKLRMIKKREKQVEGVTDLRGLGEDPILKESFPHGYLAVKGMSEGDVTHLLEDFKVGEIHQVSKDWHVLVPSDKIEGHHSLHAIRLFGLALVLEHQNIGKQFHVGQFDQLRFQMKNAIAKVDQPKSVTTFEKEVSTTLSELKGFDSGMTVETAPQYFLKQAGFEISASEELKHFSSSEFTHLLNRFQENTQVQSSTKESIAC